MFLDGHDIALAFGLMLFMEGVLYAVLPRDIVRRLFLYVAYLPVMQLRFGALCLATIGLITIWCVQH